MSELQTVPDLLGKAESAVAAGDFASADELLRAIARIHEDELGGLHPELAKTLNNLAIVAEKTGRVGDAETFYRRAVAIASASPSPDDPMLAASRQNLEDFCRAHGLPIDGPAAIEPPPRNAEPEPQAIARDDASADVKASGGPRFADSHIEVHRPRSTPQPSSIRDQFPAPQPTGSFAKIAIAVVVFLVIAALFVMRPWTSREASAPSLAPASAPTAPQASEPARPQVQEPAQQPSAPPAVKPAQPPTAAPRVDEPRATGTPRAAAAAPVPIALVTAQLCRTLSTSGSWQCEPAGDSVAPGRLVLYTRVKSPRDTVVVHRWYRGTALRQSVELEIRANANEGYRTFSRQTVDAGEEWRVEVRSASGDLLHEQRVSVR
jgi:hypothetical protein